MFPLSNHREFDLFRGGSTSAFYSLFKRYYFRLYHHIFPHFRDAALTNRYILQIFGQAWDDRVVFDSEAQFLCYLFIIAGDRLLGVEQSAERRKIAEQESVSESDVIRDADNGETEADIFKLIMEEVERLPRRRKEVIKKYLQKMTTRQIAEELKISEQTVRNHKTKAVDSLRMILPPSMGF
jgi:RNA polymerase sigma factor (sigma-70 family)